MFELLKQRLKSKTYIAAVVASVLTILEVQSGFFASLLPAQYRAYTVMLWPILMLTLREFTSAALAANKP
jgi:hypothetical protein